MVDLANIERESIDIAAHEAALSCMALSLTGTRLATASEKGTLIRVFDTTTGDKVAELRRGAHQVIIVYILSFNLNFLYFCRGCFPQILLPKYKYASTISSYLNFTLMVSTVICTYSAST